VSVAQRVDVRPQPPWVWAVAVAAALLVGMAAALATDWALQVALVGGLGTAGFLIAGRVGGVDARMTQRVFLFAFALRIAAAYVLHFFFFLHDPQLLAGDDLGYDREALQIAEVWRDRPGFPVGAWPQYEHFIAFLSYLFPGVIMVSRLVNAFMGSLSAVFVTAAGRNLFDRRAGMIAGIITAIFPSFLVWSSLNLKEAMAVLGITLIVYEISRLRSAALAVLPGLFLGMLLVAVARPWTLFVGAAGFGIASLWIAPWGRGRVLVALAGIGLGIFVLIRAGAGESEISTFGERSFVGVRESTTLGGSALDTAVDLSSPETALSSAPIVFGQVLFGPFPWTAVGVRQVLALPEVLLWYALLLLLWRGIRLGIRTVPAQAIPLLGFAGALLVAIVLLEGNLGLAFRHRIQAFVVLFVFIGAGLEARRRSKREAAAKVSLARN
jgi:hypothetical protein